MYCSLFTASDWSCVNKVRAHGGEITDVGVQAMDDAWLIASSGRDRMVQLFEKRESEPQLIQTMDDHVGAVGQLMFINEGEKLLSCSADRTVIIRDRATREMDNGGACVAYLISRVITLKTSPVSMTLCPDDSNILYLSTMDRCVSKFDIPSGKHLHCFKASDSETTDAVILGSLKVAPEISGQSPKVLIGVSSTDKSIRVYDLERDQLLTGEFGHTEGVTDALLLERRDDSERTEPERILISTGMDGILMIWNLSVQQLIAPDLQGTRDDDEGPMKDITASKPPLRKVLSRSELAGFQRPESPNPSTPTPTRDHSPTLLRKMSRLSLAPSSLKNHTLSEQTTPPTRLSPTPNTPQYRSRQSPSPVSPKSRGSARKPSSARSNRRTSLDFRNRGKTTPRNEFGSLEMSTEQVCRTLRAYRKKLNGSSQRISSKELERELSLTLRAVTGRGQSSDESGETETDSSGKDLDTELDPGHSSFRSAHLPRHMPSTPSLRPTAVRHVSRSRSYGPSGDE